MSVDLSARLDLARGSWPATEARIRRVPQYAGRRVSISPDQVYPDDVSPLCLYVRSERIDDVYLLAKSMLYHRLSPFEPVVVRSDSGSHLLVPPIIERREGSRYVLINGLHRLFAARQMFPRRPLDVVVVEGVADPLPADPIPWDRVEVRKADNLPGARADLFVNFRPDHFRPIREHVDELSQFPSHTTSGHFPFRRPD